jgi:hypothetical protein
MRWTLACVGAGLWAATPLATQTLTTLFSFNYADGLYPTAGLVQGTDENSIFSKWHDGFTFSLTQCLVRAHR